MPNRILRDGILSSEAVNTLQPPVEVFYRRVMSVVDDYGRFDARPGILRAACFPLQLATVREADISRWIAACVKAGLLALYEAEGKSYLILLKLGEPRAKHSKYPEPSDPALACAHLKSPAPALRLSSSPAPFALASGGAGGGGLQKSRADTLEKLRKHHESK